MGPRLSPCCKAIQLQPSQPHRQARSLTPRCTPAPARCICCRRDPLRSWARRRACAAPGPTAAVPPVGRSEAGGSHWPRLTARHRSCHWRAMDRWPRHRRTGYRRSRHRRTGNRWAVAGRALNWVFGSWRPRRLNRVFRPRRPWVPIVIIIPQQSVIIHPTAICCIGIATGQAHSCSRQQSGK